jgi:hypothetical protein
MNTPFAVMTGLVPTIRVSLVKTRVQGVDARHKGRHDELDPCHVHGFRAQASGLPRKDGGGSTGFIPATVHRPWSAGSNIALGNPSL